MVTPYLPAILEQVQRRLRPSLSAVVTDAQLLERFLQNRDQAAFELLMWRHGPMVFGVCRRILHHTQDAEDAFQATFLMLSRKAASIGKRESVSGWLYTVAYRIALRAKARSGRRSQIEKPLDELPIDDKSADPADLTAWHELRKMVDAELNQIPEKYRTAFILCHLEGKTCEEAAEHLGCPRGTVQSRVGRARERLRARLSLRGWTSASTPLTHLLEQHGESLESLSPALIHATVQSAVLLAVGNALGTTVAPSIAELMIETASGIPLRKLRYLAILALLALLGGGALVWGTLSQPEKAAEAPAPSCHSAAHPPTPSSSSPQFSSGPPLEGKSSPE
jgi:RNA polymerase sigma factor (sigma-70 family)